MAKLNWQIVDRYFAGEATAAERELVERWLAGSPAFRMLAAEIRRGSLDDVALRQAEAEVRRRLEADIASVDATERPRFPKNLVRAMQSRSIRILKAAAAAAVVLGGGLVARQAVHIGRDHDVGSVALRTVTAPAGRRTTLPLPDGSQVILSPGSTVRYAAAFDEGRHREILLEGEAYFDVRHNRQRPFVVRAGDLVAEDLGTQFVVRAYPEDSIGRVAVRQGLVEVAGAVISPGEVGSLGSNSKLIVERADTASWFAWTQGRLVFDGMPLRDAVPKLNRWYDLEFRLADPALGDIRLVAALPDEATDALDVIALALRLRTNRQGRVVTLERL